MITKSKRKFLLMIEILYAAQFPLNYMEDGIVTL